MTNVSRADVGVDPADDAGTNWHPRRDKREAWDAAGNLRDLDDPAVHEHLVKPESDEQVDGARRRRRENRAEFAAEDSIETGHGEI